jgi:hypothetical protein
MTLNLGRFFDREQSAGFCPRGPHLNSMQDKAAAIGQPRDTHGDIVVDLHFCDGWPQLPCRFYQVKLWLFAGHHYRVRPIRRPPDALYGKAPR